MDKVIKRIQIDLYSPTCYEVIKAQQGDNELRVIEFEILNQGEPYTLTNVFARMEGHRGDGSPFMKDCTISDNIISVTLNNDVLFDAGYVEAKVVLYDTSTGIPDDITQLEDSHRISTIPFKIHVQKDLCDKSEVVEKQSVVDYIMAAIDSLQGFKESLLEMLKSKAEKSIYGDGAINLGRKEDTTIGYNSVALGNYTTASGGSSLAEGANTIASGGGSHAEGRETQAKASYSHAEGTYSIANGEAAHAEGSTTNATGTASHAEGMSTTASNNQAHAEGYDTKATAPQSHAEGYRTTASGNRSHAEGTETIASGDHSHAEGICTISKGTAQHVQGKYNVVDDNNKYAHIVGGGTSTSTAKNIHTLDWDGNADFAGDVVAHDESGNEVSLLNHTHSGGGGSEITIDNSLSTTSTNPVQNKVITKALNKKADNNPYYMTSSIDGYGSGGYVAFARLQIKASYRNSPIEFEMICRGRKNPCRVSIQFDNGNTTDPSIASLIYSGADYGVFALKIDTSIWELYYTKSESYDLLTVTRVSQVYDSYIEVTHPETYLSTKPTANVVNATLGYNVGSATKDGSGNVITETYLPKTGGTISGNSTTTPPLTIQKASGYNGAIIELKDSSGTTEGIGFQYDAYGLTFLTRHYFDYSENSKKSSIILDTNNYKSYVTSINGNASTATKATQDASGNNIVNTYAKKSSVLSTVADCTASTKNTDIAGASALAELDGVSLKVKNGISTTVDLSAGVKLKDLLSTFQLTLKGSYLNVLELVVQNNSSETYENAFLHMEDSGLYLNSTPFTTKLRGKAIISIPIDGYVMMLDDTICVNANGSYPKLKVVKARVIYS